MPARAPEPLPVEPLRSGPAWKRGTVVHRLPDGVCISESTGPERILSCGHCRTCSRTSWSACSRDRSTSTRSRPRSGPGGARRWWRSSTGSAPGSRAGGGRAMRPGIGPIALAAEQTARGTWPAPAPVVPHDVLRLHRFALVRSTEDELVLESPLSTIRFLIGDGPLARLLPLIGRARPVGELCREVPEVGAEVVAAVLGRLVGAGLVERAEPGGRFASASDPVLRQWDFHDLLMHSRARSGRFDAVHGAAYPYVGQIEPLPARRPVPSGATLPLARPDLARASATTPASPRCWRRDGRCSTARSR